jgi:hypothetical protein
VTWVRLADDFYDHPKVLAAGPLAGWLWIAGIAYANRYLTDGYLPSAAVRRLTDLDDPFRLAAKLVDVGLWELADGGYGIHDYATYQPTAEAVKTERERTAERVAEWRRRQKSTAVTAASGTGVTNGRTNGAPGPARPGPLTIPDPADTPTPLPPPSQAREGERNPGRRRGAGGEGSAAPEPAVELPLAPPTPEDVAVWARALADVAGEMSPGNAARLSDAQLVGRGADGGLRLRAPPGAAIFLRSARDFVARALLDAGDAAGPRVMIVEA